MHYPPPRAGRVMFWERDAWFRSLPHAATYSPPGKRLKRKLVRSHSRMYLHPGKQEG